MIAEYILVCFARSLGNGIFQKRSTSRTRILSMLNDLNIDLYDLLNCRCVEERVSCEEVMGVTSFCYIGGFLYAAQAMLG